MVFIVFAPPPEKFAFYIYPGDHCLQYKSRKSTQEQAMGRNLNTCLGDNCVRGDFHLHWRVFLLVPVASLGLKISEKSLLWDTHSKNTNLTGSLNVSYTIQNTHKKSLDFPYILLLYLTQITLGSSIDFLDVIEFYFLFFFFLDQFMHTTVEIYKYMY